MVPLLAGAGAAYFLFGPMHAAVIVKSHMGNRIRLLAPLGTLNYLTVASRMGIFIKDGAALERVKSIDTVLFDKTGTLTTDAIVVGNIHSCSDATEEEILHDAALAERKLTHPIARAIVARAAGAGIRVPEVTEVHYQIGAGIRVDHEGRAIRVGSPRFMRASGVDVGPAEKELERIYEAGHTLVLVASDQVVRGVIELKASIRPEVPAVLAALRARGIRHLGIVSGDLQQPVQKLAESLGIDDVFAEVLPGHKADIVEQLQKQAGRCASSATASMTQSP